MSDALLRVLSGGARFAVECGDSQEVLKALPEASIDAVVTDPPYGLSQHSAEDITEAMRCWVSGERYEHGKHGFMSAAWDSFPPSPDLWREVYRVLKPGGHLLAFAGSRTMDLMGIAIRLAGFELRNSIGCEGLLAWNFGSGFPKSVNVSKLIDARLGAERELRVNERWAEKYPNGPGGNREVPFKHFHQLKRVSGNPLMTEEAKQWEGWGSDTKPAFEPILVFRKPLIGTIAENLLTHGTGALNIDGCRVGGGGGGTSCPDWPGPCQGHGNAILGRTHHTRTGGQGKRVPGSVSNAENTVYGPLNNKTGDESGHDPSIDRFPPNLVLVHLPDCERLGEAKVRGSNHQGGGWTHGIFDEDGSGKPSGGMQVSPSKADEDGYERFEGWLCATGCPVAKLNAQAGWKKSGARDGHRNTNKGNGVTMNPFGEVRDETPGEASEGPVSRFFPVFQHERESLYYASKARTAERWGGCSVCQTYFPLNEREAHKQCGRGERLGLRRDLTEEQRAFVLAELAQRGVRL